MIARLRRRHRCSATLCKNVVERLLNQMPLPRLLIPELGHLFEEHEALSLQAGDTLQDKVQLLAQIRSRLGRQIQFLWLVLNNQKGILDNLNGRHACKERAPRRHVRPRKGKLLLRHVLLLRLNELRQSSLLLIEVRVFRDARLAAPSI